jgi:hypothetical protein
MKAKKAALKEAVPETKEDREETKDVVQIDEVEREIAEGFGEYRRRLLNARVDSGIFPRSSLKLDR